MLAADTIELEMSLAHACLAQGHDSKNGPLLPVGEVVGRVLDCVCLAKCHQAVRIGRWRGAEATVHAANGLQGSDCGLFGTEAIGTKIAVAEVSRFSHFGSCLSSVRIIQGQVS